LKDDVGGGRSSLPERKREIVALILIGIAVFLLVALYGGEGAGAAGRGVRTALVYMFGRLAVVVPLVLVGVAATTVFVRVEFWRTHRFGGVLLLLFGLFLLVAAGGPPFGTHGEGSFVRVVFEGRGGAVGEALFVGFHRVLGTVGVGILGWVTGVVGFMLATGVTGSWLGIRMRRAGEAVKRRMDSNAIALPTLQREPSVFPLDDPFAPQARDLAGAGFAAMAESRRQVRLGPIDLVGEGQSGRDPEAGGPAEAMSTSSKGPFGDSFEEWMVARPRGSQSAGRTEPGAFEPGRAVVDGARAFSDLYEGEAVSARPSDMFVSREREAGQETHGAREDERAGAEDVTVETPEGARLRAARDNESMDGQDPLPGLERPARRVELAGSEPAYVLPEPVMLHKSAPSRLGGSGEERDVAGVLLGALAQFGVEARVIGMVVGPRVTRYELQLAPGTKVARVSALRDDLAYALASTEIRILAPIPGKSAVGVEVPNQRPDFVTLGDIYREFPRSSGPLMVWLGKDISGKAVYADLTKLPHLLIAGTTGSGKSGCVNCLVSSVLLRSTPEQVRMIMIDPKKVELSHYDRIPHLLVPVVTNMKDAAGVLHNVVKEMEDRYELLELDHARSLAEVNKTRARRGERLLPYILIVIDELADLMMASPQEVEDHVIRLAQKSRAVGIHLVVATQRPSADVITGMIKANIPSRIAFAVSSQTDSRVILDVNGAETLLGMGDMLFKPLGSSHLQRVQGAYITEEEIATLVNHWRHQAEPEFREELLRRPADAKGAAESPSDPDSDELLVDAARLVAQSGSASVSMLQRRLRVGYTRAGRLIDMLERRGIVGPWEGSKPRQILVGRDELADVLAGLESEQHREGGPAAS
jgi:S-DNA-T family DNA segregation ATPase FtsK/SpoIIIE